MAKDGDDYQFWTLPEFLVHGDDGEISPELFHGLQKDGAGGFGDCFSPEMTPELYHSLKRTGAGLYTDPFGDDECFAELTREFAHSSSSSSIRSSSYKYGDEKVWGSFGSPESALSSPSGGGACSCNRCFSCNTPRRAMRSDAALELLHAAVEEIARLRMVEEAALFQRSMKKKATAPVSVPPRIHRQNPLQQPFQQEMNAFQFQMLRQQLEVTQKKSHYRQTHREAVHGGGRRQAAAPASVSAARPVFHGNPAPKKRECAGTGVFLPRVVVSSSSSAPPRKKHGSSAVSEGRNAPAAAPSKYGGWSKASDRGEVVPPRFRSGGGMVEERKRLSRQHSVAVDEPQLPQEWTY